MKAENKVFEIAIFIEHESHGMRIGPPMSGKDWEIFLSNIDDDLDAWTTDQTDTPTIDPNTDDVKECCGKYDFHDCDGQCQLINELDEKFNSFANA